MISLVIDATVAVKWSIPQPEEDLIPESARLLKRYKAGENDFIVPDVFWAEVGNVASKGHRRGRWSRSIAETIVREMKKLPIPTVPSLSLLPEALEIALTYERSLYDSLYVALAVRSKTEFVTADERLVNSLAGRFPVKWLASF